MSVLKGRDMGIAGNGNFIEPVGAVNDPGLFGAKLLQHARERLGPGALIDAQQLTFHARRIGEWPEEIEDGAKAEFFAHGSDMTHGGVMRLRKQKTQSRFREACLGAARFQRQRNAKRFQHIRGSRS